jgi:hypothetical protein
MSGNPNFIQENKNHNKRFIKNFYVNFIQSRKKKPTPKLELSQVFINKRACKQMAAYLPNEFYSEITRNVPGKSAEKNQA